MVQKVDKFHAKDRGEEGGVGDGCCLKGFGKVGEIRTELDKPLKQFRVSTSMRRWAVLKGTRGLVELTKYAATGRVTRIMPTKTSGMTVGGYLACSLKMWWIWGCLAYRRGADTAGGGVLASCLISTSKASAMMPWAEPKEPMTTVAWMGFEDAKKGVGISFWVYRVESSLDAITKMAPAKNRTERNVQSAPFPSPCP